MLLMMHNTRKNPEIRIVNWNSVFSNPRRVRWMESEPPPNAPLNEEPLVCRRITVINTMETIMVTRLSAISTGRTFLLQRDQ